MPEEPEPLYKCMFLITFWLMHGLNFFVWSPAFEFITLILTWDWCKFLATVLCSSSSSLTEKITRRLSRAYEFYYICMKATLIIIHISKPNQKRSKILHSTAETEQGDVVVATPVQIVVNINHFTLNSLRILAKINKHWGIPSNVKDKTK